MPEIVPKLYREIRVWKRLSAGSAVCYRCFEDLATHRFCVQSADFFQLPVDDKKLRYHERQSVELFIEIELTGRCDWFNSLEEAIKVHDADFA
jgi:hypothetical protein